ncbi:MAG: hypothetical protein F6J90_17520 [Moorea sp. SIOASIH]|uniref:hypothetical protein n=1 Tax=Moorena sp. SIOASIH TaxID=2607817 RepID=UPI0013BA26BF|nr:hypothetical protein [Moorena sp. SIOASIH]NEO38030.1 hypothetical protein [Moorena sp. SIOASIH]
MLTIGLLGTAHPTMNHYCLLPFASCLLPITVTETETQTTSLLLSISLGISNTEGKSNEQIT